MQKFLVLIFLVASIYAEDHHNSQENHEDHHNSQDNHEDHHNSQDNPLDFFGFDTESDDNSGTLGPAFSLYQSEIANFYLTVDFTSFSRELNKLSTKAYFSILTKTHRYNDKAWLSSWEQARSSLKSDYSKIGIPMLTLPTGDFASAFASGIDSLLPSISENASNQQPDETGSVTGNDTDQESSETGSVNEISGSNTAPSGSSSSKKESSSKDSSKESSSKESSSKLSSSGTSSGSKAAAATMYMAPFGAMVGAIGVALL